MVQGIIVKDSATRKKAMKLVAQEKAMKLMEVEGGEGQPVGCKDWCTHRTSPSSSCLLPCYAVSFEEPVAGAA